MMQMYQFASTEDIDPSGKGIGSPGAPETDGLKASQKRQIPE
jgi:hypothetical protein